MILFYYYIFINVFTLILYYLDKQKAIHHRRRISERFLFVFSFLGGSIGAYSAMKLFHHKTRKYKFYIINLFAFILHFCLLLLIHYQSFKLI
ncbi:MAG: DUF1294 domain-containing protein [Bacilli bacterium]|nr:DUF1294 domain-containing protein [Bacilli bacterium]